MQLARVAVIGMVLAAAGARPAAACGFWSMLDKEKQLTVGWLINSGSISTVKSGKRVGALYLDIEARDGIKVVTSKKVIYDVKDGKLRRYGRPVATIDAAGAIAFAKRTYTVEFSDEKQLHDMPSWTLTVKRDGAVIIESTEASALCAFAHAAQRGIKLSPADQQDEIRRRVAFYLAWREVGL